MARGYPDYFGQSMWPKYGAPLMDSAEGIGIANLATETLHSIAAQGVLYDLTVQILGGSSIEGAVFYLKIDGEEITRWVASSLYERFYQITGSEVIVVEMIDFETRTMIVRLRRELPFHSSVVLTVYNGTGDTVLVRSYLVYYVVS